MLTFFNIGRIGNGVSPYFLPDTFCFCPIYCYISLYLRLSVYVYRRVDFGVKTSERMCSDVVQIQLNIDLNSQFTALRGAHVIIADFWPKLTGEFLSLNVLCIFFCEFQSKSSGKWCHCWESKRSRYFTVRRLILMSSPSETRRSSFLVRVILNQAVHHFGEGIDLCIYRLNTCLYPLID